MPYSFRAIISSPTNGVWQVVFRYIAPREVYHTLPTMTVPCDDYHHACAVADAYNGTALPTFD